MKNAALIIIPIVIFYLAYLLFFFFDIRKNSVKYLPKWTWFLICAFVSAPLGGVIYYFVGRTEKINHD